ncbi:hypothetical protein NEOLEDRAFT_66634 [Neolentinus lepideus HHB14362 ss-1]|uniref:Uncharacterized protein n=1 Tax=Neolentinus lepideus HHB14362 ss-1 TaxID=1314782 RepID=A0A165UAF1_9AGAM|nr:hypothetical protein NEOLEDRAFT_66634 [Neolentinus lepideus HHB14362 ss-1]
MDFPSGRLATSCAKAAQQYNRYESGFSRSKPHPSEALTNGPSLFFEYLKWSSCQSSFTLRPFVFSDGHKKGPHELLKRRKCRTLSTEVLELKTDPLPEDQYMYIPRRRLPRMVPPASVLIRNNRHRTQMPCLNTQQCRSSAQGRFNAGC